MHLLKTAPTISRRTLIVVMIGALLIPTWVIARGQGNAKADGTQITATANCQASTINLPIDIPWKITDTDPVTSGQPGSVLVTPNLPPIPLVSPADIGINGAVITQPLPAGITLDSVVFGPSPNMTPTYVVNGSDLVVTLTPIGTVTAATVVMPTATLNFTVNAAPGSTLTWKPFSKLDATVNVALLGGALTASCVIANPNQVANTTPVVAPVPPAKSLAVGDASIYEGNDGSRTVKVAVVLNKPSTSEVDVNYSLSDGTAHGAAKPVAGTDDYTNKGKPGTVKFMPSPKTGLTPTVKTISVPITGDTSNEGNETVNITLSGATNGYAITKNVGVVTILDDDNPTNASAVQVSIAPASANEGNEGVKNGAPLAITFSKSINESFQVDYTLTGGNCSKKATDVPTPDCLWAGKPKSLKVVAGAKGTAGTKAVSVGVVPDVVVEGNEPVTITITGVHALNPSSSQVFTITHASAAQTIVNDD